MSREKMQQYQVIIFKELPYVHIDKYICVPNTWIIWRSEPQGTVIVAYPVEEPSRTQERVRDYTNYSMDWKAYLAVVEYTTNGYKEAETLIKYLESKSIGKTDRLNQKRSCENPSTVPMQNTKHKFQPGVVDEVVVISSDDELDEPYELPHPAKIERSRVYKSDKNTVMFPTEFDPTSSKWTLKYDFFNRRKNERLIELKPEGMSSGIYVDVRELGKCFELSTDDMTLAENLMMAIFTKTALVVCTLSGRAAVGGEKKPVLNVRAVDVLVSFVLRHGFGDVDKQMIRKRLSTTLCQLRSQH